MSEQAAIIGIMRQLFQQMEERVLEAVSSSAGEPGEGGSGSSGVDVLEDRIARLEHQLQAIAHSLGLIQRAVAPNEPLPEEVLSNEVMRQFMENYPAGTVALDLEDYKAVRAALPTMSRELLLERIEIMVERAESPESNPYRAYEGRIYRDILQDELARREPDKAIAKYHEDEKSR